MPMHALTQWWKPTQIINVCLQSNWSPSIGAALVQPGSSIAWAKTKNIMLACAVLTLALFASLKLCGKRNGAPRQGGGAERERLLSGERRVEGFGFARRGDKSSDVERAVPTPAPKPTPAPPKPTPEPPKPQVRLRVVTIVNDCREQLCNCQRLLVADVHFDGSRFQMYVWRKPLPRK